MQPAVRYQERSAQTLPRYPTFGSSGQFWTRIQSLTIIVFAPLPKWDLPPLRGMSAESLRTLVAQMESRVILHIDMDAFYVQVRARCTLAPGRLALS